MSENVPNVSSLSMLLRNCFPNNQENLPIVMRMIGDCHFA